MSLAILGIQTSCTRGRGTRVEGVGSDGVDGPPQALDGSVVAGGVGAMDTLADIAAAVVDMAARVLAAAAAAGGARSA